MHDYIFLHVFFTPPLLLDFLLTVIDSHSILLEVFRELPINLGFTNTIYEENCFENFVYSFSSYSI